MSFCRITGRSRGLPKPNYFPLLPPISPSAAKRYCRITGKSYGLPSHNFIPVILTTSQSHKLQCKITTHCSGTTPLTGLEEYGHRKHVLLPDYRYLFPRWDEGSDTQKELLDILETRIDDNQNNYVYRVEEKSYSLVFPAQLEYAIRDGDVRDVMLAKDSDRILLKMRQGKNVSVEMCDLQAGDEKWATLHEGEGPRPEIVLERQREEKRKKRRQRNLRRMTKVFEENTPASAQTDPVNQTTLNTIGKLNATTIESLFEEKQRLLKQIENSFRNCSDLVKPLIESWDWKTYEQMANSKFKSKISVDLPKPLKIEPIVIDREPGTITAKVESPLLENTLGFDAIPHVAPLTDFRVNVMDEAVLASIRQLTAAQLADTENAIEKLEALAKPDIEQLPTIDELPQVLKNMKRGKLTRLASVGGLKIDINKAKETFLPGQNISTPMGDVFIPGHTVATPGGPLYVPGMTVNTPHGVSFIPGHVTSSSSKDNEEQLEFVAGQIIGDKFVCGQTMGSPTEPRFCEGQTIFGEDGKFNFVPGIVHENQFICGQTLKTPTNGEKFVPGQTITNSEGDLFFAGQSIQSTNADGDSKWDFVEGQSIVGSEGQLQFVPGKTITTEEGSKFIAGQTVGENFIPGIQTVTENGEDIFTPGLNIDTEMGSKFIQGMITESEFGPIFMPGILEKNSHGTYDFAIAKNMNEIVSHDSTISGFAIDCHNAEVTDPSLNVFGYMIQTEHGGVEFYPEKVSAEHRPAGKQIPGRLFKQNDVTKFIPGIMSDDKASFIPGQVISTEHGDQFVPGQVVETEEGLKFIPGQVIDTKTGSKFVPGQTFETKDGPRFVPGQIVHTRAGPTFIPGQIIYTEEDGERFVPGQVVDTDDGPRFVPGKVVEKGDTVTFIPGQIVETAEGPMFVAPDLLDDENGEQQFSVQSFQVTPEELKLIKPNGFATNENGDLTIDTTLLRQLSEAGMRVGRQIEMSAVDLVLQSTKDSQCIKNIEKAFVNTPPQLITSTIEAVKQIIDVLKGDLSVRLPIQPKKKNNKPIEAGKVTAVEEIVKKIFAKMNEEQKSFYEVLEQELLEPGEMKLEDILMVLQANTIQLVNNLRNELEIEQSIKELTTTICNKKTEAAGEEYVMPILRKAINDENISGSLDAIIQANPEIIREIINIVKSECLASGGNLTLHKLNEIVIDQVQEMINQQISGLCLDSGAAQELSVILLDAIQLAKALEVPQEIINQLSQLVEEHPELIIDKITHNGTINEIISRTILIQKIIACPSANKCDGDESGDLLQQLRTSPYSIRSNRHFIEVFRKSGSLLALKKASAGEEGPLTSSHELPNQVLFNDNPLVLEDFFLKRKTKTRDALVIIKDTFKAVVPRHLSHAVLTGKCSYTLLDEHGIRHFEPMNVLEALNMTALKRMPTINKRFSTYQQCKIAPDVMDVSQTNGHGDDGANELVDSDEIDGIMAMATKCTSFGGVLARKRYSVDFHPHHGGSVVGCPLSDHEKIYPSMLPKFITSYRYF